MWNNPRNGIVRSMLAQGTLAALLGMTLGCGSSSPAGPTPTPVAPVVIPSVTAVYTVTANTNTVAPGGLLRMSWTASIGGAADWISLFKQGDPNTAHGWWTNTKGAATRTVTLSAQTHGGRHA